MSWFDPKLKRYRDNPLLAAAYHAGMTAEQALDELAKYHVELQRLFERATMMLPPRPIKIETPPLMDACTHFTFPDGTDCYLRHAEHGNYSNNGVSIPEGTDFWEARGCKEGESVQWHTTQLDALRAIGKWPF